MGFALWDFVFGLGLWDLGFAPRLRQALVLLGILIGCAGPGEVAAPSDSTAGSVSGTVTLLGTADTDVSAGRVSLYASLGDFEVRRAARDGPLTRTETSARTYAFVLEAVRPGTYYVTACFAFGCGEYRDSERGELVPVVVPVRRTTWLTLQF